MGCLLSNQPSHDLPAEQWSMHNNVAANISRPGRGASSGVGVAGARPLAQPLHIRHGLIRAGFRAAGHGPGDHERGGGLKHAAKQIGGAGHLQAQGSPVLAAPADLGDLHLATPARRSASRRCHDRPIGQREPDDPLPLAYWLPADRVTAVAAEWVTGKGLLSPGLQVPAGAASHLEDSGLPRYAFSSSAPPPRTFTNSRITADQRADQHGSPSRGSASIRCAQPSATGSRPMAKSTPVSR